MALSSQAVSDEPSSHPWDLASDTWVATDALERTLPTSDEVGLPRANKTVGIFYFLWLGRHGERGPYDISKILQADPTAIDDPLNPNWGPMYAPHHWSESLFGYYVSDDDFVLRKHAQMLSDAGVDMVVFDVTNQLSYPESWQALCRVWDQSRREGNRVPKLAFLCPFGDPNKVAQELWEQLYQPGNYEALWFRWEGKPLILADPGRISYGLTYDQHEVPCEIQPNVPLGQEFVTDDPLVSVGGTFPTWGTSDAVVTLALHEVNVKGKLIRSKRFADVVDNAWLMLDFEDPLPAGQYYLEASTESGRIGWWSTRKNTIANGQAFEGSIAAEGDRSLRIVSSDAEGRDIQNFFTFRKPQPSYFVGPTGPEQWGWLEVTPQHAFFKTPAIPEQITVGVAQNALDGKLSVLSNPHSHGRSFHDGREPEPQDRDTTGRNFAEQWERAHQVDPPFVFVTGWNEWIAGRFDEKAPFYGAGPVTFVDQFSQEFSRDCEPMRGGHGDNYYYQLASQIRRYKGVRALEPIASSQITMDGHFEDWAQVSPEFRDTIGDPVHRDYRGWGKDSRYVNQTGRNDIVAAKVSFDDKQVYFYVRTQQPLTSASEPNWMQLLIDSDSSTGTGWLGYDWIVNRRSAGPEKAVIERNVGGFMWDSPKEIVMLVGQNEIELAVPREILPSESFHFKWADNSIQEEQWTDFTLNGDVAPNDRFNYRAVFK
ncbi:MAG: hypothetical protein KDA72_02665 [Planctomycetales bacterium]|nr:hypothetical protein [Planctomycetales bacterium]